MRTSYLLEIFYGLLDSYYSFLRWVNNISLILNISRGSSLVVKIGPSGLMLEYSILDWCMSAIKLVNPKFFTSKLTREALLLRLA